MKLLLLLGLFSVSNSHAFDEAQTYDKTVFALQNNEVKCEHATSSNLKKYGWSTSSFKSRHDYNDHPYNVRYTTFGCLRGNKGSAVVSPGRTESSLKYLETAYDLIERGYSPIYVIDHRGQGLSPRFLDNHFKGHVEEFTNFVDDFEDFVNEVVLAPTSAADSKKLYLLSNSMGGAIAVRYFQRVKTQSLFKKALLFGPMLKINFKGVNLDDERSESGVRFQASLLCLSGLQIAGLTCESYANPNWTDYNPQARNLDPENPNPHNLTHSLARFKARDFLWNEFKGSRSTGNYHAYENWESAALGGPSVRWIWQATKYNQIMRQLRNLKDISTPIVVVTGDQDIRADLDGHRDFCQRMDKVKKPCKLHLLEGAFHELMVENDYYRGKAFNIMLEEFAN